jgi:biopolymer transport protein ExbD
MITRPLDLASRLRQPPGPLAGLPVYLANLVLLGLFFVLFGSRFVLSPGLPVDFALPTVTGSLAGAAPTSIVIAVKDASFIITEDGLMTLGQLRGWLEERAAERPGATLLVQADVSVSLRDWSAVAQLGRSAGLQIQIAAEPVTAPGEVP